jgi:hypothetical protein
MAVRGSPNQGSAMGEATFAAAPFSKVRSSSASTWGRVLVLGISRREGCRCRNVVSLRTTDPPLMYESVESSRSLETFNDDFVLLHRSLSWPCAEPKKETSLNFPRLRKPAGPLGEPKACGQLHSTDPDAPFRYEKNLSLRPGRQGRTIELGSSENALGWRRDILGWRVSAPTPARVILKISQKMVDSIP